jgi:integrative and conjugative element protein (TIGR02256 family)
MRSEELRFSRPEGQLLVVAEEALLTIKSFQQHGPLSHEAGGMLLGRVLLGSNDMIIDRATTPSPNDKRGRFFFFRSRGAAQKEVVEAWKQSAGTINYLGEWHTHPEKIPTPSCKDRRNWIKITKQAHYSENVLFFLIAGMDEIRIWQISRGQKEPVMLTTGK